MSIVSQATPSRTTAAQGEIVRLFCSFSYDGLPSDPQVTPQVYITNNDNFPGSSSSSSNDSNAVNPSLLVAERLACGLWFVDYPVADDCPTGQWFDVWNYRWQVNDPWQQQTFGFTVNPANEFIRWDSDPTVDIVTGTMREYINLFNNATIYQAQHIETNWEQGQRNFDPKVVSFAFRNWNNDPRPEVMVNRRLVSTGWQADYNGRIVFSRNLDPEDVVQCAYNFRYFNDEEVMSFLNLGLYMMNATPPPSEIYASIASAPFGWRIPILAGAGQMAMQRLVLGLSWQNRRIIYGEDPQLADAASQNFRQQYGDFKDQFEKFAKNAKTLRIPAIAAVVQPEFTLPGGRCMASDTLIKSTVDGALKSLTISDLYNFFVDGSTVTVASMMADDTIGFAPVSRIWESGEKQTFVIKCSDKSIRLSAEHLVCLPLVNEYRAVKDLVVGDSLMIENNGVLEAAEISELPAPYKTEQVFDIEVPSSENFIGNGIVSHNSRWFRLLFKGS